MTGRVALVTGASGGIGAAVARSLAAEGWSVALCAKSRADAARELEEELQAKGAHAHAYVCDLSDGRAVGELARGVESAFGRVDAIVHGAGSYRRTPLLEETEAGWRAMFDHNLHPVFHVTQALLPGMQARRFGRVVTFGLASVDHLGAHTEITAHAAAKAALLLLTRSLAKAVAADGVTVNCVSPGVLDSGGMPRDELERLRGRIPSGKIGSVDDAVGAVRYLLSDAAGYVSGANLQVSGGWGL